VPVPAECLRRYHLDDAEVTAVGPGRTVRRLPWASVLVLVEGRDGLVLSGRGVRVMLPHDAETRSAVLTRVVAGVAAEMWALVEEGERIRLAPQLAPGAVALAWWAWVPALAACAGGAGAVGAALATAFVAGERTLARLWCAARAVSVGPTGVAVRARGRRVVVPWGDADVVRTPLGLWLSVPDRGCVLVPRGLPNFAAVAPVIETKARLGPCEATVHFRVGVADGELAIVGEVEPMA
jgi:hypothetical protein